jgi:proteasome lid subunit RPN8/RPN11
MIRAEVLTLIYEHANACYPRECCGFVRASGRVHKAKNAQDDIHKKDPKNNPRDATAAYAFSPDDILALSRGFASADPPVIIYHSHPDVGAYFSNKDAEDALYQGRLIYNADFLVVDVRQTGARGAKLFRYGEGKFACVWSDEVDATHSDKLSRYGG